MFFKFIYISLTYLSFLQALLSSFLLPLPPTLTSSLFLPFLPNTKSLSFTLSLPFWIPSSNSSLPLPLPHLPFLPPSPPSVSSLAAEKPLNGPPSPTVTPSSPPPPLSPPPSSSPIFTVPLKPLLMSLTSFAPLLPSPPLLLLLPPSLFHLLPLFLLVVQFGGLFCMLWIKTTVFVLLLNQVLFSLPLLLNLTTHQILLFLSPL